MTSQNVFSGAGSYTGLTDRMIGDAFPIVRHVADNIEFVKHVSAHLEQVYAVSLKLSDITNLAPSIDSLLPIYNSLTAIGNINASLSSINNINGQLAPLVALSAVRQDLLNAEIYIRSFELRFGDADGAFAQATATAQNAANAANISKASTEIIKIDVQNMRDEMDAFLMATTTEQVRMAAFIVEINNRTLV